MKKLFLTLLIVMLAATAFTGCGQSSDSNDEGAEVTSSEAPETTDSNKSKSKINVKNLTADSVPIGISETAVKVGNNLSGLNVSFKITNNNDEYEETVVSVSVEVLNSSGTKIAQDTYKTDRALSKGETYVCDDDIYFYKGDLSQEETYTLKVVGIEIEDSAVAEQKTEFDRAIRDLDNQIANGEYNTAQLTWDEIKETYSDNFSQEIKKAEAAIKDEGFDPNNLSAGPKSNASAESTASPSADNG